LQEYAKKHKTKGNGFGLTNLDGVSRTMSVKYCKDGSEIFANNLGITLKESNYPFQSFFVHRKRIGTSILNAVKQIA
jgi:hypothetical protein